MGTHALCPTPVRGGGGDGVVWKGGVGPEVLMLVSVTQYSSVCVCMYVRMYVHMYIYSSWADHSASTLHHVIR